MGDQRTVPHLQWELHLAHVELASRQIRIDILLNRNAALQIEVRNLRLQVTSAPGQGPEGHPTI